MADAAAPTALPATSAFSATGMGATMGTSAGITALIDWVLPLMHLPPMSGEAEMGALTVLMLAGHGILYMVFGKPAATIAPAGGKL